MFRLTGPAGNFLLRRPPGSSAIVFCWTRLKSTDVYKRQDYYSLLELGVREQVIILSDGMGNGPRAAAESKATIVLLERLLEAGFKKEVVLRSVNSLLQLRTGDETFATVDMALIDLVEGEVELLKIGAAPSMIKREKEVFRIGAPSLPLGILLSLIHI